MKKLTISMLLMVGLATVSALSGSNPACAQENEVRVRMAFNEHEVIIEMLDHPASRDFLSMLPLTASFDDYARTEKISYLPRNLTTQGSPTARQTRGDFTYYAPWGNLAVFYKGVGSDGSLYTLGHIISGKENLAGQKTSFTATLSRVE